MDNQLDSKGGDQNIGQGDHAIGKQVNILLRPVKMKTVVIAAVLVGGLLGGYVLLAPANNSISIKGNQNSGPIAIAQGTGAAVNQTNNYSGGYNVSLELFDRYVKELDVTDVALVSFFKIIEQEKVPRADLDAKLHEIAATHKELLLHMEAMQSEDPVVLRLKQEAKQAIEAGDYAKAEALLNEADARDVQAIEQIKKEREKLDKAERQRRLSSADTNNAQALTQRIQLRYANAAAYWQKAADMLPEDEKKERSRYLSNAAFDLDRIARYAEALPLLEQSLVICQEIGDRAGEGTTLNNISQIYDARGDYGTALKYLEQSLVISQEIGDRAGEGTTLSNIGAIHHAKGDYTTALKYLEQSLAIRQEISDKAGEGLMVTINPIYKAQGDYPTAPKYLFLERDKAGEGTTLNNIGEIYRERGDYGTALKYLEQSLVIHREVGNRAVEGRTLNNISQIYAAKGNYGTALKHLEQSLVISREIGDRAGEGATLNNIGQIYSAKGDYGTALKYLEQSLVISREIGNRAGEGTTLNNIGDIYRMRGDYGTALKYLEQSLVIRQEIGDRAGEAVTSWNIGLTYKDQGYLAKAKPYISRAVQLAEEIGHPKLEEWRKTLKAVRAKLKGR